MKSSRYFGKWLIVILIMAIGIGTFAALSLSDRSGGNQDAGTDAVESSSAEPSSYLSNQRKHDIDMEDLGALTGDYRSEDGDWELSIRDDYEQKGPYLSVSRTDSEKPGFEGRIMYLQKGLVIVEIDQDRYSEMPDGWKLESDDKYAILDCVPSGDGAELGYRGSNLLFVRF
jgi:hypothetical protein